MRVTTKAVTVVRLDLVGAEWDALRQLVAEGLTVVETVTPAMQAVASALQLRLPADPMRHAIGPQAADPEGGEP